MEFKNGMNPVSSPPPNIESVASVIFVHGLFGGPWKTFAAKVKGRTRTIGLHGNISVASSLSSTNITPTSTPTRKNEIYWPRDLLTQAISNVTVYTYGYDADVTRFMKASGLNTVHAHGRNLLNALSSLLETKPQDLPIILIAHSLGGLVVKEALNQSASTVNPSRKKVFSSVRGILFLGTPHKGSKAASYGQIMFLLTKIFASQSVNTKLMSALQNDSEILDRISTAFYETLEQNDQLRIWSFVEEKEVRKGVLGTRIVPPDSAKIGHVKEDWGTISEDHRNIAKYASPNDDGFVKVIDVLKSWIRTRKTVDQCLASLDDEAARVRVHDVDQVYTRNVKSFEWLFTDKTHFSRWLTDDNNLYDPMFWITGKPGSGKSTLMRYALESPRSREMLPESTGEPIAYFFHLRGKAFVQKSLYGMLKEVLFGLLKQFEHFFGLVRPIFQRMRKNFGIPRWDIQSLTEMLLEVPNLKSTIPGRKDRIVLFIDALDENQDQKDNVTMIGTLKLLSSLYADTRQDVRSPVLKICLASRPWPIFMNELGNNDRIPSFAIHDFTVNDIKSYSMSLLKKPVSQSEEIDDTQSAVIRLSQDITIRAKGVFVWVRIVVDNLRQHITDGTPVTSLQQIISGYPEELKDFYKYTISRIPPEYCQETEAALKVILGSRIDLTLQELFVIVQVCIGNASALNSAEPEVTKSWLNSRSGGLIEVTNTSLNQVSGHEGSLRVQFIHQTAQDFVREGISGLPNTLRPGEAHFQASGTRLIELACLDSHPPYYDLRRVSKQLFSYLRDVEREIDTRPHTNTPYLQCLQEWGDFTLHKFPAYTRDRGRSSKLGAEVEDYSYYLEDQDSMKWGSVLRDSYALRNGSRPDLMTVSQNLYHTQAYSGSSNQPETLLQAALGPRLSEDRLDRPRMLRRLLKDFDKNNLDKDIIFNEESQHTYLGSNSLLTDPRWRPSPEHSERHSDTALIHCLAVAERGGEISSKDILKMAQILLDAGANAKYSPRVDDHTMPTMSLLNFCARYKGDMSERWVKLLRLYGATLLAAEEEIFNELVQRSIFGGRPARTLDPEEAGEKSAVVSAMVLSGLCLSAVGTGNNAMKGCYPTSDD